MELKRAVVTGIGALTPIGNNQKEYWEGLKNGVSGSDLITHFDPANYKTKFACEIKGYDASNHFERKELRKIDPFVQYGVIASDEAIIDSGLDLDKIDHDRIGVIWGSGIGGFEAYYNEIQSFVKGNKLSRFSPFFIPKMIIDIAAGYISIRNKFKGPNFATVSACASSCHAVIDAFNYIRLGKAEVFVAGGSEAAITEPGIGGFNAMQAISTNNEEYKTASRPFDGTRDGFVMGEGAGALIIEEYEHAKSRGATIYAEIIGGGMTADAYHLAAPHPEGEGACKVMQCAISDANIKAEDLDYINVHGTATPTGDIGEAKAIKSFLGEHAYKINVSSTKSMVGHLLGAAGAVELIATILAMKNSLVPPTINFREKDPALDYNINYTFNKAQEKNIDYALSNAFGFGGHNASVAIKKHSE